ncbi:negative transcriptional regulator [Dothidotthia symphoricarpi CBS 119687]|uniref:Negative transcriptional regulator n=1 Tax=Dothidotthia symphoricarpi CBS 119687 TaxID=1392245 RepID=A0A6A6A1X1_9PLEO|nr:negative transcriptional regulator [Dothidotthia symphoricarpi CBS 119687]KAF2124947.1 negative transcriptional regulator [Dothidotthia symphoricarpi CBS 119687]
MYLRTVHAEHNISTLHQFIRANPLGIFTTAIESQAFPFIQSSHIPFVLDTNDKPDETDLGILRGHIARANPQAKTLIEQLKSQSGNEANPVSGTQTLSRDVMILFNGPAHHYITPKFYRETKPATGKVVPTWNYSAVQVYGRATIFYDIKAATTGAFLDKQIRDLSLQSEIEIMGNTEKPWLVDDAPASYIGILKKAIIGVQIEITDIGGKWKMSQEMGVGDQAGVAEGLEALQSDVGEEMARTVRERCKK